MRPGEREARQIARAQGFPREVDDGPDDGLDDYSRSHGGRYCEHGTYLGTPGGADLMCGACEAGDEEKVRYAFKITVGDDPLTRPTYAVSIREAVLVAHHLQDANPGALILVADPCSVFDVFAAAIDDLVRRVADGSPEGLGL